MKITLDNVARIRHAEVEIEGITVVSGYNGTGKSTICKALYAICDAYGRLNQSVLTSRKNSIENCISEWENKTNQDSLPFWSEGSENFFNLLNHKNISVEELAECDLHELLNEAGITSDKADYEELYNDLMKIVRRPFSDYAKFVIERSFTNCFSRQLNTIGLDSLAKIDLEYGNFEAKVSIEDNKLVDSTTTQILMDKPVYIETSSSLDMMTSRYRGRGTNTKIPFRALYDSESSDLTLEEYDKLNKTKEICNRIMQDVTHGSLVRSTTSRDILYQEDNVPELIMQPNIASGLKNILIIQRMLENGYLNSHSLLLIDEPEVNLHPEWQIRFAEILVLLYKELDIKIVLNTHSPYFMRAIETKMAEHQVADKGRYYFMDETDHFRYTAKNVTNETELVYRTMYKPLEEL